MKLGFKTVHEKGFNNIISETYYIGQKFSNSVTAENYFFSIWELDKDQWETKERFSDYIENEARKLLEPIIIIQ